MTESSRTVVAVAGDQMADWQIIGGHAGQAGLDFDWFWRAGASFQLAAEPLGAEPLGGAPAGVARRRTARPPRATARPQHSTPSCSASRCRRARPPIRARTASGAR